jgi:hypothetical protein
MSDMFDDGRWLVGALGFGVFASSAMRGSRSVDSLSQSQKVRRASKRRWGRWSDDLWSQIVEGPAAKITDKQLQAVYYALTAEWIGEGDLEDPHLRRFWFEVVPRSKLTEDQMFGVWNLFDRASAVEREIYSSASSVSELHSLVEKSKRQSSTPDAGAMMLDFPDWQFLPGMLAVFPDGSILVESRSGGSSSFAGYVVKFMGGKVFFESFNRRPSGASRGTCPSSFMEQAREQGQIYAFACGRGVSAASFLTSRRLLVVR